MSDKDLDGLDQIAAAYRKLPRPEPSPALDAAILAKARAALAKPARRSGWTTWVASAAAVTLAVGLAWQVRDQSETGQPAPFAPAPASAPAPLPAEADGNVADEAARQRAESEPLMDSRLNEGFAREPAPEAAAAADKPAAIEEKRKLESAVTGEREQQDKAGLAKQVRAGKDQEYAEPPRPVPVAQPATEPAPPPAPPAPAAPAASAEPPTDMVEAIAVEEPAVLAAPAEPFQQPAAGAPGRADSEAEAKPAAAKEDAGTYRRERDASGPDTRDADRAKLATDDATATTAPLGALGASSTRVGGKSLDDSLAHIRELLREGKRDEARRELAELRKRFPDATVPDDLRGLLD